MTSYIKTQKTRDCLVLYVIMVYVVKHTSSSYIPRVKEDTMYMAVFRTLNSRLHNKWIPISERLIYAQFICLNLYMTSIFIIKSPYNWVVLKWILSVLNHFMRLLNNTSLSQVKNVLTVSWLILWLPPISGSRIRFPLVTFSLRGSKIQGACTYFISGSFCFCSLLLC